VSEGTEQPTEHRLGEARKRGDIPFSQDFQTAAALCMWMIALLLGGAAAFAWLRRFLAVQVALATGRPAGGFAWPLYHLALGTGAVALLGMALAALPVFGQTRGNVAKKRKFFDAKRVDPASGLKQLFKLDKFVQLLMSVLRFGLLAGLSWYAFGKMARLAQAAPPATWLGSYVALWHVALLLLGLASAICLLIGFADLLMQRKLWIRRNRMKKDEIKREHKEQEGDPMIKGMRRAMHRDMAER
jgi:type III secretion protein U